MSKKTFGAVRSLWNGRGLSSPPETDEQHDNDEGAQGGGTPKPVAGPTLAQVEEATAIEVASAVTASNVRWNTVMTSDAGAASPKAAARLLMAGGGSMSADEIVATLGDMAPAAAANVANAADAKAAAQLDADRDALASDPAVNKKTGGAGGSPSQRKGEGDDGASATIKTSREKRAARLNRDAEGKGGKRANA